MAMQILRYGALALVSASLVLIALVIGGLVPLDSVRDVVAKIPAMVQVTPEKPVEVAKVEDAKPKPVEPEPTDNSANDAEAKAGETKSEETKPEETTAPETDVDTQPENADTQETAVAPDDKSVPAFDVLRVEKDGSMVVAGRALPNSSVELRTGAGKLIASGKSGAGGDFVLIPDNPLPTGDYSLNLIVTGADGREIVSTETATVSIPKDESGDVLAMITAAGAASRIIAKPSTLQSQDPPQLQEPATGEEAENPDKDIADAENSDVKDGVADVDKPATEQEVATITPETETAPSEPRGTTTEADVGDEKAVDTATSVNPEAGEPEIDTLSTASVQVEAVEIERDQIFVAGKATRGSTVRIYIDDKLVGETRGTADNRFLVSRRYSLEPGQHRVRADSIDNATGKVIARAEVPLLHESVEEVASPEGPENSDTNSATADTDTGVEQQDKVAENSTTGNNATGDETDIAMVKPEADTADANSGNSDNGDIQKAVKPAPETPAPETKVILQEDTKQEDANGGRETSSEQQQTPAAASESDLPAVTAGKVIDKTAETPAKTMQPAPAEVATPPEVVTAKKAPEIEGTSDDVIRTGSSVIIKPGDSLWRISRKTYGRGIRYTTIYEANRDQIRNPHRIYIGQIFKIPDHPNEELVEADG